MMVDVKKMSKEELAKWLADEGIDIFTDAIRPVPQVVQIVIDYRFKFVIEKGPKESKTDEDPPRKLNENTETIPICEYLGLYNPTKTEIIIFNKGIKNASAILNCNPDLLEYIVRIHEYAHAIIHIGFTEEEEMLILNNEEVWPEELSKNTMIFTSIDKKLHEHLAQLLTYHSLVMMYDNAHYEESKKIINKMLQIFWELNKRQPHEYIIDDYLNIPHRRIIESIDLLKKGWLKGAFEVWDIVIKW